MYQTSTLIRTKTALIFAKRMTILAASTAPQKQGLFNPEDVVEAEIFENRTIVLRFNNDTFIEYGQYREPRICQ